MPQLRKGKTTNNSEPVFVYTNAPAAPCKPDRLQQIGAYCGLAVVVVGVAAALVGYKSRPKFAVGDCVLTRFRMQMVEVKRVNAPYWYSKAGMLYEYDIVETDKYGHANLIYAGGKGADWHNDFEKGIKIPCRSFDF